MKRKIHAKDYSPFYFTLCKKWPGDMSADHKEVTCKNCLRLLKLKHV